MKIILFDPLVGGHHIEYASFIIRYLVEQGDEVVFITWKPDKSVEKLREMRVIVKYVVKNPEARFGGNLAQRSLQMLQGMKYCFNFADTWQADIVHHLYLERSEFLLYLQLLKKQVISWKLFATLFWPYFIHNKSYEKVGVFKRFYHSLNRWALGQLLKKGRLNGLFVHTKRIRDKLLKLYDDDSLQQNIFVVPDPIEPLPKISQEDARDRLELPQRKPIILFFGGLRWDKGPDILLKTLSLIEDEVYTVIAGKPVEICETNVKQYKQSLKKPEYLITCLGHIPDEDVANYFLAADAVVLPYRQAFKGTSGILQHAAAAGKPVIVSDVGEVGPIVRENKLGIIVEPESPKSLAEGIKEFLTQPMEWREQIKSHALQYANANHWRKMASGVRKVYLFKIKECDKYD